MRDFGNYECLGQVARGSTGIVWQARHRELDRIVAVKELSPELRDRPGFLDVFRAEARHLATLDDPHVIRLFDYVEEPERAWMAEEWVDGLPLARLLAEAGPLTAEQSLGVLQGVLGGLAAAHAIRLVHGDVSPSNILVAADGTAKLVDFGLMTPAGAPADGDAPGGPDLLGTPAYIAPETITEHARDPRSDVYGAAAVLVEMLTTRPPYPAATVAEVLRAHVAAPVPEFPELRPAMRELVRRALAKDPGDRPDDARAFLAELESAAESDHGAGWLARSSVAPVAAGLLIGGAGGAVGGLSAGLMGGAGSAASGGGVLSGAAASVTSTAAVSTGTVSTGTATAGTATSAATAGTSSSTMTAEASARTATSGARKLLYLGGGAAGATAAVVAAVLLTGSSSLQVAGNYRYESRVVSSEFPDLRPGASGGTATWTLPDCDAAPCGAPIRSDSGRSIPVGLDGPALTAQFQASRTEKCPAGGGDAKETVDERLTLRADRTEGKVQRFTGTLRETTAAITVSGNCVIGPPKTTVYAVTLNRVR